MRLRLSMAENLYLAILTVLLALVIALGGKLMDRIARFQARKLREAERVALMRDVEMWLEVQRGRC